MACAAVQRLCHYEATVAWQLHVANMLYLLLGMNDAAGMRVASACIIPRAGMGIADAYLIPSH